MSHCHLPVFLVFTTVPGPSRRQRGHGGHGGHREEAEGREGTVGMVGTERKQKAERAQWAWRGNQGWKNALCSSDS